MSSCTQLNIFHRGFCSDVAYHVLNIIGINQTPSFAVAKSPSSSSLHTKPGSSALPGSVKAKEVQDVPWDCSDECSVNACFFFPCHFQLQNLVPSKRPS